MSEHQENNGADSLWNQSRDYDAHKLHATIPGRSIGSEFGLGSRGGYAVGPGPSGLPRAFRDASFTANGRAALKIAAHSLKKSAGVRRDTVLLPAYLCHSMVQPFAELGLRICFYPIARDLAITADSVRSRMDDRTLAVMVMHYFGFSQSTDLVASILKESTDVSVIDDRTHLLLSDLTGKTTPSSSAISIYSPRKWGPFPDLGIITWPEEERLSQQDRRVAHGYDWRFLAWRLLGGVPRSLFFVWPKESLRRLSRLTLLKAEAVLDRRVRMRRASPISRMLWNRWDWTTAAKIRRENYSYLLKNWPSSDTQPLFEEIPDTVCPLGFAVRSPERDNLQRYFISKGIYLPVHWQRPSQVSREEFPEAADLSEHELTIPIDQRYSSRHMDYILEAISQA